MDGSLGLLRIPLRIRSDPPQVFSALPLSNKCPCLDPPENVIVKIPAPGTGNRCCIDSVHSRSDCVQVTDRGVPKFLIRIAAKERTCNAISERSLTSELEFVIWAAARCGSVSPPWVPDGLPCPSPLLWSQPSTEGRRFPPVPPCRIPFALAIPTPTTVRAPQPVNRIAAR